MITIQATTEPIAELISALTGKLVTDQFSEIMTMCQALSGEIWIGSIDGKFVCCWSLIPPSIFSRQAYLWMYHTDEVEQHTFAFVRRSQIEIAKMLERFPTLYGHCKIGEPRSRRWLRWLGAEFSAAESGLIPFTIRKRNG